MKKLLSILLVLCTLISLCACANSQEETVELQAWEKQLGQKNIISVGISPDYPPYESLDNDNNVIGFDADFAAEIVKNINEITGTNYELEFVQMSFDTIITAIQTGQVDLGISGFTYDEDRVGQVLFSTPYTDCGIVAVTKEGSEITTLADLQGKVIGAQLGTTCADAAKAIEGTNVIEVQDVQVMMQSLNADAYDAVLLDKPVAENYCANMDFVMIEEAIEDNATYVICAPTSDALIEVVNKAVDAFIASSAYDELQVKWGLK